MSRLLGVGLLGALLMCADTTAALANCAFGSKNLGGSIPAHATDTTRFFTAGGGPITISIITQNGSLDVQLPGCGWSSGGAHACTTNAGYGEELHPVIRNPNPFQVSYIFSCE
jgi:hypothetical protein